MNVNRSFNEAFNKKKHIKISMPEGNKAICLEYLLVSRAGCLMYLLVSRVVCIKYILGYRATCLKVQIRV